MTRRSTRLVWGLLGICLAVGAVASLVIWLGPPDKANRALISELGAIADIAALLFWLLVFAIYWTGRGSKDEG
jgi:hypothetical protein